MPSSTARNELHDDLDARKRELRRTMKARRAGLRPDERARLSSAMADRLWAEAVLAGPVVAGFVALPDEIDPGPTLERLRGNGAIVVLPRVTDGSPRLRFHRAPSTDLRPGAFGVLEPPASAPEVPPEALDVVLVPGLAFDARGARLGYGGGFYDEVGARLRRSGRARLVGLGFDFQLVDRCPAGEGDVAVHLVATNARLVRCHQT